MLLRILCCVLGPVLLAGLALAQAPPQDDPVQGELAKLRKQAEELQPRVQALQEKKAKADRDAAEKYMREFAEMCLGSILKGEPVDLIPVLSKEARDLRRGSSEKETEQKVNLFQYADSFSLKSSKKPASSYKITSATIAPDLEEAIFRGDFLGKSGETEKVATFVLRVCQEKDSQRYVIGFISVTVK
jgi:hypothetical protein